MTLKEAMKKAVQEGNALMAGRIADRLRFEFGYNYANTCAAFQAASGCSAQDFEALMYYADTMENGGRFERCEEVGQ